MSATVAASTACLPGVEPLASRIRVLRDQGLTAIELGAGVSVDGLAPLFVERDVRFFVHNYFPPPAREFVLNLASSDAAVREQSLALVDSAIDLSARLGAPFYSIHGGFITDPIGFDGSGFVFPPPQSPRETAAAMERYVSALRNVLQQARARGVMILVENNVCIPASVGKVLLQTAGEFAELFATVADTNLGLLLDTGHLNVTATTLGFDRLQFVDALEPFVRAFHVHDNDGTADQHRPVLPGSWVMDVLRRPALRGSTVIVEAKYPNAPALSQQLQWLERELGA